MAETKIAFDDADAYDRYMGRWSRAIGEKFLAWLDASRYGESSTLKYAALAQRIDGAGPAEVVACAAELHRWREELLNGR